MAVTMSRDIASRLYEAIRNLRPDWHDADDERGTMKVVVCCIEREPPTSGALMLMPGIIPANDWSVRPVGTASSTCRGSDWDFPVL